MRRFLKLAVLATALSVAACGPRPVTKVVTFRLEPSTLEQRTAAANVLAARCQEYLPSSSTLVPRVLEESVVIEFHGEAPNDIALQAIGAVQGIFRVSPENAKHFLLFSDLDVESARVFSRDDGAAIDIQLTEQAGAKMADFTKRNVGRVLVTTLDRKEISQAKISGVFGRKFSTTGLDRQLATSMAAALRHGRLPVAVTHVDIKSPGSSDAARP